jgi:hypothetical protein
MQLRLRLRILIVYLWIEEQEQPHISGNQNAGTMRAHCALRGLLLQGLLGSTASEG